MLIDTDAIIVMTNLHDTCSLQQRADNMIDDSYDNSFTHYFLTYGFLNFL